MNEYEYSIVLNRPIIKDRQVTGARNQELISSELSVITVPVTIMPPSTDVHSKTKPKASGPNQNGGSSCSHVRNRIVKCCEYRYISC